MTGYKAVTDRPGTGRVLAWLAVAVLLVTAGAAADRWLLPHLDRGPDPAVVAESGVRVVDGVAVGFPATTRGAGDAVARYESALAAAGQRPPAETRSVIDRMVAPSADPGLVEALLPAVGRDGTAAIAQTVIARVWAQDAGDGSVRAVGSRVRVQTYGVGLFGVRADTAPTNTAAGGVGLAGGWVVHQSTVELTPDGWQFTAMDPPVPAPPPDVRGTTRDGSRRDEQVLALVLGPDSWVPETSP